MAKKKPKNKNKLFLSFISSFLLLFSLSLIFFQISKKPKEVKAVAGQLNINAVSGGVQNFNQVGIGGDVTGSSAKLYVNGNVGIGTTTPYSGYKLHVAGNMGIGDTPGWGVPGMLFDYIDGRTGEFRFRGIRWNEIFRWGHTANGYDWVPTMELSGNVLSLYNNNSAPGSISIRFHPQGGNSFINSGNVGIGTTTPGAKLEVVGKIQATDDEFRSLMNTVDVRMGAETFATGQGAIGTLSNHPFDVYTSGTRRLRVDTTGNVGIGTTVPWYKLHVMGDIYANGGWLRTSGSAGWYSESYGGGWYMSDTSWIRTYNSKSVWTDSGLLGNNGGLTIGYGGTSPPFGGAIIANNVGIGTTNPQSKLSIGTSGNSYYAVSVDTGSNGVYSKGSSTGVYSHGNNFGVYGVSGRFGVYGYGGNFGVYGEGGNVGVYGYSNFNTGVSGYGGTYDFYAANSNGKSYFAGNVGIGTTSPAYRLELPNIANASGQGRANAWVTYSDIRFKENITPINNALEKINSLQGVYFDWKQNGKRDIGFIAQEVEKVLPEIVSTDPSGIKSLDYSRLTALLVQGIKEQQQQISYQSTRLSLLEKDLNLTSIGDLKIVGEDSKFEVRNSKNDLVTKIAAFSEIIVGKIKAGLIETKKLIVDGVDIVKKISELEQKLEKQEQIIRNQQKEIEALKEIVGKLKK